MPRTVKIRLLPIVLLLLVLALVSLFAREFLWRADYRMVKPQAPSPDGALVAEVRTLPDGVQATQHGTGVFLRKEGAWLRSVNPRLVFAGECDEVSTRWAGPHRLVIDCELRSGEPKLLQEVVDGVAIELVVQRRFATAAWDPARRAARRPAG
jgi:hypothetical protein